jgi:hypothetical protein
LETRELESRCAAPHACGGGPRLETIGDVELVEELSLLTTQAARMRARMADIMAELDRRRNSPMRSPAAAPW